MTVLIVNAVQIRPTAIRNALLFTILLYYTLYSIYIGMPVNQELDCTSIMTCSASWQ